MASITSFISLFVLLLATYCYSVPIGQQYDFSTSNYDLMTEKTFIEHDQERDYEFTTYDTPTSTKDVIKERIIGHSDSDEHTTSFPLETKDDEHHIKHTFDTSDSDSHEHTTSFPHGIKDSQHHKKRTDEDFLFTTSVIDATTEESRPLHTLNDYSFTTLESSTKFNARAIRSEEDSFNVDDKQRRGESESELEMTTYVEPLSSSVEPELFTFHPTTSAFERKFDTMESFSTVEPESTTFEHENVDIIEVSTSYVPITQQPLVHTETIIPGELTQTKILDNVPSRTYFVKETVQQEKPQLSQGQTRLFLEKKKSDH